MRANFNGLIKELIYVTNVDGRGAISMISPDGEFRPAGTEPTYQQLVDEIGRYIDKTGAEWTHWYVKGLKDALDCIGDVPGEW